VPETRMERIYLYAPPEEYAELRASGACWDDDSKRWYIRSDMGTVNFSRWLGDEGDEAEFGITSDDAFVAAAQVPCLKCHESIEVICIYCESGTDSEMGEPMSQFTASNIWAMDSALAKQLERWRFFRKEIGAGSEEGCFSNHCPHCGAMQADYLLHAEPGDVFFGVSREEPESIEFTPLIGRIQLSGDYSFGV
jgi:Domain of unknown function (DUF5710)